MRLCRRRTQPGKTRVGADGSESLPLQTSAGAVGTDVHRVRCRIN